MTVSGRGPVRVETAAGIDLFNVLAGKIPLLLIVIVVLAFLLLAAVFRSLPVLLVASVMNILSIGAAPEATAQLRENPLEWNGTRSTQCEEVSDGVCRIGRQSGTGWRFPR